MKKWFNYVIALVMSSLVYYSEQSFGGLLYAGGLFALIMGMIFSFDFLKARLNVESMLFSLLGFFLAFAAFGIAYPLLSKLPSLLMWSLLGLFTSASTYSFYLYQKEKPLLGRLPSGGEGEPAPPVSDEQEKVETQAGHVIPKVLDTSVVIDGRIIDIVDTGFMDGPFVIPSFVLREIQLVSDSPDPIKRSRGRRGLDMLNELQNRTNHEVNISYQDYSETREVDAKLIKLCKEINGKLITNDFNLNKVAGLQGIEVLNMNTLTNALKPVFLPGEEIEIQVVKEGKDQDQGIGYLNDGTMVVVENGRHLLNKKVRVAVTSVLQTNAGKMIFTKTVDKNLAKA